jgi:hypothetical protein
MLLQFIITVYAWTGIFQVNSCGPNQLWYLKNESALSHFMQLLGITVWHLRYIR